MFDHEHRDVARGTARSALVRVVLLLLLVACRSHPAGDSGAHVRARAVQPPGRIEGTVTVPDLTGWSARVSREFRIGELDTSVHIAIDPATGAFTLGDLAPGDYAVDAVNVDGRRAQRRSLEVRAGETTRVELAFDPTRSDRPIVVHTECPEFFFLSPRASSVRLIREDGSTVVAKELGRYSRSFAIDATGGPGAGNWVVEIADPRFERWSRSGVLPGDELQATLRGSATLALDVVDRESGARVERGSVSIRLDETSIHPNVFELLPEGRFSKDGRIPGLLPERTTLRVVSRGYAMGEVPLGVLEPGQVRAVTVRLERGETLAGRVLHADGRPVDRGVRVILVPRGSERRTMILDSGMSSSALRPEFYPRWVNCDREGRFVLDHVPSGAWTLRAYCNAWLAVDFAQVETGPDPASKEFEARLPRCVWVTVDVKQIPALSPEDFFYLRARPPGSRVVQELSNTEPYGFDVPLDDQGRGTIGWVPPGTTQLSVVNGLFELEPSTIDVPAGDHFHCVVAVRR